MSARFVSANAHGGGGTPVATPEEKQGTVLTAAKRADVLNLQEADAVVHKALRALSDDWEHYIPTGKYSANTVSWRKSVFRKVAAGRNTIYENKPGISDGPDRTMTWVVLEEISTGRLISDISMHLIHQAFTSHPERQAGWFASVEEAVKVIKRIAAKHPTAALAMSGDFNNAKAIDFIGLAEQEVPSPGTFGSKRYDRWFLIGASAAKATGIKTPSDHDALVATITIGKPNATKPPTAPPTALRSAQRVLAEAKSHLGFQEGRSGGHWNNDNPFAVNMGWENFQAWCASFVCSNFKDVGLLQLIPTPSAGVDQMAAGFKKAGRWSEYPAIGAVAFYGTAKDLNHTGHVEKYDDTWITAIEGNTNSDGGREGHSVLRQKRARRSTNIVGYGYPDYPEGIKSADPAWATGHFVKPGTTSSAKPTTTKRKVRAELADVSHHQGKLDLPAAKKAGLLGLYHKATEGETFVDAEYAARRKIAKAIALPFGPYHFGRPDASKGDGADECGFFLEHAKPVAGLDLLPVLDLEDRAGVAKWKLDREELTDWVHDFVMAHKKAMRGVLPMLYNVFDLNQTFGCRLWVPRYSNAMTAPIVPMPWRDQGGWDMWQFTNGVAGRPNAFPGLGHVDLNTRAAGFTLSKLTIPNAA